MSRDRPRVLVIGIGNPDRGDDAAGRAAARLLKDKLPAWVEVMEHDGESTSLLALLASADRAIMVDACVSGAPEGSVRRFDVSAAPLPETGFSVSTHGLGLGEAVELARALGQLPPRAIVYAIEARSFEAGDPLSPAVAAAVGDVERTNLRRARAGLTKRRGGDPFRFEPPDAMHAHPFPFLIA